MSCELISKYIILMKSYRLSTLKKMVAFYRNGGKKQAFYKCFVSRDEVEWFLKDSGEGVLRCMEREGIRCLSFYDALYPSSLKRIFDPPPVILYRGDEKLITAKKLGIVGGRKAPDIYRDLSCQVGKMAKENGWVTVSGLARGIDIKAHQGSFGKTIGVLGTGMDIFYPKEHRHYQEQMSLISEFPLGTPPRPYHFPRRNRIIAGLCNGLVVVYGKKGSGSFITLDLGVEGGKEIFVSEQVAGVLSESYGDFSDLEKYIRSDGENFILVEKDKL